ncbi:ABC transporter permease [Candidatus Poribacteria bacterium]|nr:ABC transporter permease [Candidatus Poribacteria bacterium]
MPTKMPFDPKSILSGAFAALAILLLVVIPVLIGYVLITRAGREALGMGIQNLRRSVLRTLLTMIGIVLGVGAVVGVISMGDGARQMVVDEVAKTGGTSLIEIYRDEWDRQGGSTVTARTRSRRWGRWGRNRAKPVDYRDFQNLRMFLTSMTAISAEDDFGRGVSVQFGGREKETSLIGTTEQYEETHDWPVEKGRFISETDLANAERVAVIGAKIARDIFGSTDPIGFEIRCRRPGGWQSFEIRLQVIGVMSEKGDTTATQGWDERVMMPLTAYHSRITGNDEIERMRIKATSVDDVTATVEEAKLVLGRRHEDVNAFQYWTAVEEIATAERLGTILKLLMGVIAGIALVVAGIGIMNIMLVSVTERTREIGLRKAIGAKRRDIMFQFLIETSVLSLVGGLLGTAAGVGLGRGAASLLEKYILSGSQWPSVVSMNSIVVAMGVAFVVGVVSGVYPANRAARLTPVEAIRSD